MKLATGDAAGASADFQRALGLRPAFPAAVVTVGGAIFAARILAFRIQLMGRLEVIARAAVVSTTRVRQ